MSLRRLPDDDPERIAGVLERFARLQTLRAGLQVAALAAAVWVLVATVTARCRHARTRTWWMSVERS
jgi:hypothetical protein